MLEWLLTAVDSSRPHEVGFHLSWHARLMVFSWNVLIPIGVLWARYLKITPAQNWPQELDNKTWWYGHLILQCSGVILMMPAIYLILYREPLAHQSGVHLYMGWTLASLAAFQVLGGLLRGSKGGPTEPTMRGDHFDMTKRRIIFEYVHKSLGYLTLALALLTTITGMWQANAPRFIWIVIGIWWAIIIAGFWVLLFKVKAFDTYQAIWGSSPDMPGNQRKPIGIRVHRIWESGNSKVSDTESKKQETKEQK